MFNGFPDSFRREDEDVLNEFRQKQVNFDLEERRNDINNSRSLFIGALAGLAMAGVVGWFILAPQYQSEKVENIPVINRPQTAVKMQSSEPGGVEISNQEKTVYDIIEKRLDGNGEESILPPSEEPNIEAVVAIETLIDENVAEAANAIVVDVTEWGKAESLAASSKPVTVVAQAPVMGSPVVEEPVKSELVVVAPVVKEEPKVVVKEIAPSTKGSWQIQLMSSPNKSAVENSWNTMVKKYNVLSGQPYDVESADLGAKGIYYRLKVGNFASQAEAAKFCNDLKSVGGSCFPAKK